MKIIIVRHAQTDENASGGLAARTSEVLLNEEGVKQAKKLGEHLKDAKITHAYSSPSRRAIHTAEEVLAYHAGAVFQEMEDLREQSLGIYETAPKSVWKEARAKMIEPWHLVKPEKGESYQDVQKRVAEFFKGLSKKHSKDDTVLLVSHGGPLGVLLVDMLGKELNEENYRAHQPKNTEFTIVEITEEEMPKIHKLNSHEHLDAQV